MAVTEHTLNLRRLRSPDLGREELMRFAATSNATYLEHVFAHPGTTAEVAEVALRSALKLQDPTMSMYALHEALRNGHVPESFVQKIERRTTHLSKSHGFGPIAKKLETRIRSNLAELRRST